MTCDYLIICEGEGVVVGFLLLMICICVWAPEVYVCICMSEMRYSMLNVLELYV